MIGSTPRLVGFPLDADHFPMTISGTVTASDVGKAVTLDTSQDATAKLAGDGDSIYGRLESYEDRKQEGIKVGTVSRRFLQALPLKASDTATRGDLLIGGGAGSVKKASTADVAGLTVALKYGPVTASAAPSNGFIDADKT